jgi:hypothetical protein
MLVSTDSSEAQYLLSILHEPTFYKNVDDVYAGSQDPYKNFVVRLVIAIGMQKLDTTFAGLADSYYLSALPYLEGAIRPLDLGTLQCFALICQYSTITPTRTAAFWITALAARICQELGITDESTIGVDRNGNPLPILEVDMRRRLYWVFISNEFGLAHSLGRVSAFGNSHEEVNVKLFLEIDDQYITNDKVLTTVKSHKKLTAVHFMKMRLLQLEVRRKLYLKKAFTPKNDQDPWFAQMEAKMKNWLESSPKDSKGYGYLPIWYAR